MTAALAIGLDDIAAGVEKQLRDHLMEVVQALGFTELGRITNFDQVPEIDQIAASPPSLAIGGGRVLTEPHRDGGSEKYDAAWQISVGVYDRGKGYTDTTKRMGRWATAVTATVLLGGSLGGIAKRVRWAGTEYQLLPSKETTRTLQGCEVTFTVDVESALDLAAIAAAINPPTTATTAHITVQPQ